MNRTVKFVFALVFCLSAVGEPAMAHHSFAMFDQTKLVELKNATVARFVWGNPHVFVVVRSGETTYMLECGSPSNMKSAGWKFNTLKGGETIDVVFHPLRDGKRGGALKVATLPNGERLDAW